MGIAPLAMYAEREANCRQTARSRGCGGWLDVTCNTNGIVKVTLGTMRHTEPSLRRNLKVGGREFQDFRWRVGSLLAKKTQDALGENGRELATLLGRQIG